MTLLQSFGALLKYETHRLFHKDASVLVVCTPAEWEAFQAAAKHPDAPVALAAIATAAIPRAGVVTQNGKVTVSFAAGDYHALGEAHEAIAPKVSTPEPEKLADKPPEQPPADPQKPPPEATGAETSQKLPEPIA